MSELLLITGDCWLCDASIYTWVDHDKYILLSNTSTVSFHSPFFCLCLTFFLYSRRLPNIPCQSQPCFICFFASAHLPTFPYLIGSVSPTPNHPPHLLLSLSILPRYRCVGDVEPVLNKPLGSAGCFSGAGRTDVIPSLFEYGLQSQSSPCPPASQIATCKQLELHLLKEWAALISSHTKWDAGQSNTAANGDKTSRLFDYLWIKSSHKGTSNLDLITIFLLLTDFPSTLYLLHVVYTSTAEENKCLLFSLTVIIHHSRMFLCASLTLCLFVFSPSFPKI